MSGSKCEATWTKYSIYTRTTQVLVKLLALMDYTLGLLEGVILVSKPPLVADFLSLRA